MDKKTNSTFTFPSWIKEAAENRKEEIKKDSLIQGVCKYHVGQKCACARQTTSWVSKSNPSK